MVTWYKNWYRLTNSCCIASQTFITCYLTYQSATFNLKLKTSIKKNWKFLTIKSFRRFRGFALHYKSAELAESWENFVLLPHERLDYFLTKLKLVPNLKNSRKLNQPSFLLERQQQVWRNTRTDRNWLILVALPLKHVLLVIWHISLFIYLFVCFSRSGYTFYHTY